MKKKILIHTPPILNSPHSPRCPQSSLITRKHETVESTFIDWTNVWTPCNWTLHTEQAPNIKVQLAQNFVSEPFLEVGKKLCVCVCAYVCAYIKWAQ